MSLIKYYSQKIRRPSGEPVTWTLNGTVYTLRGKCATFGAGDYYIVAGDNNKSIYIQNDPTGVWNLTYSTVLWHSSFSAAGIKASSSQVVVVGQDNNVLAQGLSPTVGYTEYTTSSYGNVYFAIDYNGSSFLATKTSHPNLVYGSVNIWYKTNKASSIDTAFAGVATGMDALGNSRWVIGGINGKLGISSGSSPAASTWSAGDNLGSFINAIAFGNNQWAAVTIDGKIFVCDSADPTNTWTLQADPGFGGSSINFIRFFEGVWLCGGNYDQLYSATSANGTWTSRNPHFSSGIITDVAFNPAISTWAVVNDDGSNTRISTAVSGV